MSSFNINDSQSFSPELATIMKFGEWEYFQRKALQREEESAKLNLILVNKDWLNDWKKLSGYEAFRPQLLNYLDYINESNRNLKNENLIDANYKLIELWETTLMENNINPSDVDSLGKMKNNKIILTNKTKGRNQRVINGYENFEILPLELNNEIFNRFNPLIIDVQGSFNKGKFLVPLNEKVITDQPYNYVDLLYIGSQNINSDEDLFNNPLEEVLFSLPTDKKISEKIKKDLKTQNIRHLANKIFIDKKNKNYIKPFSFTDEEGKKYDFKVIHKNKLPRDKKMGTNDNNNNINNRNTVAVVNSNMNKNNPLKRESSNNNNNKERLTTTNENKPKRSVPTDRTGDSTRRYPTMTGRNPMTKDLHKSDLFPQDEDLNKIKEENDDNINNDNLPDFTQYKPPQQSTQNPFQKKPSIKEKKIAEYEKEHFDIQISKIEKEEPIKEISEEVYFTIEQDYEKPDFNKSEPVKEVEFAFDETYNYKKMQEEKIAELEEERNKINEMQENLNYQKEMLEQEKSEFNEKKKNFENQLSELNYKENMFEQKKNELMEEKKEHDRKKEEMENEKNKFECDKNKFMNKIGQKENELNKKIQNATNNERQTQFKLKEIGDRENNLKKKEKQLQDKEKKLQEKEKINEHKENLLKNMGDQINNNLQYIRGKEFWNNANNNKKEEDEEINNELKNMEDEINKEKDNVNENFSNNGGFDDYLGINNNNYENDFKENDGLKNKNNIPSISSLFNTNIFDNTNEQKQSKNEYEDPFNSKDYNNNINLSNDNDMNNLNINENINEHQKIDNNNDLFGENNSPEKEKEIEYPSFQKTFPSKNINTNTNLNKDNTKNYVPTLPRLTEFESSSQFSRQFNFPANNNNNNQIIVNKNLPSLGLTNSGRPINLNAVIQAMAHLPEITEGILDLGYKKFFKGRTDTRVSRTYATVINNLFFPQKYKNNTKVYSPEYFRELIFEINPSLDKKGYIECKDLFSFLIENLHEELNTKKNNNQHNNKYFKTADSSNENQVLVDFLKNFTNNNESLISKNFFGLIKLKYLCHKCKKISFNFQNYSFLFFNLHSVKNYLFKKLFGNQNYETINLSLEDCLDFYTQEEELNDSESMYCPNCEEKSNTSLFKVIYSTHMFLPIILDHGDDRDYFGEKVEFPFELDLTNYVEFKQSPKFYYLCGVVGKCEGRGNQGKFLCYSRMERNAPWFCYDDEKVNQINEEEIKEKILPYILIYHKIE